MIPHPFALLRPYADALTVGIFTRDDNIRTDAAAGTLLEATTTAGLNQIHGGRAVIVRGKSDRTEEADAMLTDVPGLALCIRWADCQNFVLFAPKHGVAGVIHAGWKGVLAGVIPETFRVLKNEWGIDGSDVLVGAGPSLCKKCSEFTDPRRELPGFAEDLIDGRCADLREAATRQLASCNVALSSIERLPDCTRCDHEKYWTYRGGHRNEVLAGHTNMLACVLLDPAHERKAEIR